MARRNRRAKEDPQQPQRPRNNARQGCLVVIVIAVLFGVVVAIFSSVSKEDGSQKPTTSSSTTAQSTFNSQSTENLRAARRTVLSDYANADMVKAFRLTGAELQSMRNPRGEGVLVYADQGRPFVWLVLDGKTYALNGAAKTLTPYEPFLREASQSVITRSGLDTFSATEVLGIVGLQ